jgi:hypothetical protein
MLKFVIAFLLMPTAVIAQQLVGDKVYELKLSGADIAVITNALGDAPYKQARPVIDKIIEQTKPPEPLPSAKRH